MKGLLYKDISIMTRSFKGNILLLVALYGVLILVTRGLPGLCHDGGVGYLRGLDHQLR